MTRPVILLIPGVRGDPAEFDHLAPMLGGFHLLRPAIPEDAGADLRSIAAALLAGVDAPRFHVVAGSFGGLLAWAFPEDRVASITAIGTVPGPTPRTRRAGWVGRALRAAPERLYREVYGAHVRAGLAEDGVPADTPSFLPSRRALADRLVAIGAWGLPARPPRPSTWMWGATDAHVTWGSHDVRMAGMEPLCVPGGHRPHLSHPAEVRRWLPRA